MSTGQSATGTQIVTINNNGKAQGSTCTINTKINSYGVSFGGDNVTISPSSLNINYGGTGTVTITPAANYHIDYATCTNGYTISGLSAGASATGSQTVRVNNNNNAKGGSCTIYTKINSYNVTFGGNNVTILPSSLNINYGGNGTVTITPADNYYIDSATCTNGYTISGLSAGTDATKAQTVTVNNNSNAQGGSCTIKTKSLCPYKVGDEFPYNYTGGIQQFEASCPGKYKLEVWGGEGQRGTGNIYQANGGYGGYSAGEFVVSSSQTLYIAVGGGSGNTYNGGGVSTAEGGNGGGATHIATTNRGVLSNYKDYSGEVLIVAGGGGGGGASHIAGIAPQHNGGTGGGQNGGTQSDSCGSTSVGTQTSGYAFGQGGSTSSYWLGGGGGGGWYGGDGGGNANGGCGGSGGSGHINSSFVTSLSETNGVRAGNGYAKITVISLS